jgi:hypothetical protein
MDGAADVFQMYDVQALLHSDYECGPVDLTVDIFDMGSDENAFGMYAAERSPVYDFVAVGAGGYRDEGVLNFFQGRYYIKMAGFGQGADGVLQQFAAAISGKIAGGKALPPLLGKLPEEGKKPRTEKYLPKNPLGHPFLSPAYQATYDFAGRESTLLVSVAADKTDAEARLKSLADHFRRTGQWGDAPEFGSGAARGSNSFEGSVVATASGCYLLLLLNPQDHSESFFQAAAARLQ